jgi:hypothetical protein
MVSAAEATEIDNHFKQRLQQSKERWAARGKDARIAANNARLAKNPWREVTGLKFLVNEAKTPGTRPFAVGFAIIGAFALYAQMGFSDEMKANSLYWQTFHAKKPAGGH